MYFRDKENNMNYSVKNEQLSKKRTFQSVLKLNTVGASLK